MSAQPSYVIDIELGDEPSAELFAVDAERAARATLAIEGGRPDSALTIMLSGDALLRDLNQQYRGESGPTDVLSFPAGPTPEHAAALDGYLGDIAISIETAARQAAERGHTTAAEVQLLTVHGILHLLGYDHLDEAQRSRMWARQAEILMSLGLQEIQPTETEHDAED